MSSTEFDIGNVYSVTIEDEKVYYIAVSKLTLVTCRDKSFGEFTTRKNKKHEYESISVEDLCFLWDIETPDLDAYMVKYFAPDEQAKYDARKRAKEDVSADPELEMSIL